MKSSDQNGVELALKVSEARFRTLFENSPDAIFVEDLSGNVLDVNKAATNLHGMKKNEMIGMNVIDLVPPQVKHKVRMEFPAQANSGADRIESFSWKADGSVIPVEISISRIEYLDEPALLLNVRDISDRVNADRKLKEYQENLEKIIQERTKELNEKNTLLKKEISDREKMETKLLQAQKMEAIGQLAGGVAHDFNNILTIIKGYSEIVLKKINRDNTLYKNVEQIKLASDLAESLTNQLLAFSRQQIMESQLVNLNELIPGVQKMMERLITEDIIIKTSLHSGLWKILVDPMQIKQAIINLCINARDAMPEGGNLMIKTDNVIVDKENPEYEEDIREGEYVSFSIEDSGVGMDLDVKTKIFEPFFTTKDIGKGTGLGLSMVYGVVKQSNGYISVRTVQGRGTSFKLLFPRNTDQAEETKKETGSNEDVEGKELILIVEDDESVREMTREMLEMSGYDVITASDGKEALFICEEEGKVVHLVLSDVVMPGMNGRILSEKLLHKYPQLKILLMSGYSGNIDDDDSKIAHKVNYIKKPFSSESMLNKIKDILEN
ncbi:MAG: PAS domain S-box protein [Acidobacteriota bacterium]